MTKFNIRNGTAADWDRLAEIFHQAVRKGALAYTEAQRTAWSPICKAGPEWSVRMTRQTVWVAEANDASVGFMTLEMNGYLDCAYIAPGWQGKSLFRKLYTALETQARLEGLNRIYTHASLHARAPFAAMGFAITRPETVKMSTRTGQSIWLPRFAMEKAL